MDDRNAQVGWTEAQWNRVREEVLRAWHQVRVAGSFLPAYGPLPRGTQVVPSEVLKPDGTIDDQATAAVLEISLPVTLNRQQVMEEDLSTALLEFRRRATQVGQLEDWYIFNGQYPRGGPQASDEVVKEIIASQTDPLLNEGNEAAQPYRPNVSYLDPRKWAFLSGVEKPMAGVAPLRQKKRLLERNPGALGLIEGATKVDDPEQGDMRLKRVVPKGFELTNEGLQEAIVRAITTLDDRGYVAPHVCVFGLDPFLAANSPIKDSTGAVPRDRLEPLIGREILHASAIDLRPARVSAGKTVTDNGRAFTGSSTFRAAIQTPNKGVVLTRRLDHGIADQTADVYVGDAKVGTWSTAGTDLGNNWLDSDFTIPDEWTNGKIQIQITVKVQSVSAQITWNEFYYWVKTIQDDNLVQTDTLDVGNTDSESAHNYEIEPPASETWTGTRTLSYPAPSGPFARDWPNRGLVLSLAGDPVDIAIVTEATTEFRQVDEKGSYIFAVFERFALRIKDSKAIVPLAFEKPEKP